MKKILKTFTFALLLSLVLVGCTQKAETPKEPTPPETTENDPIVSNPSNPVATITMENGKTIEIELFPEVAPNTVNNFITLANSGFYDGVIFHRVIPGFMIQGGDPEGSGMGGPGYSIKGEFTNNGFENNLVHDRGVLSMARSQDKNSGGSQFFIMTADSPHLDGDYASFGRVTQGMDTVDEIVTAPRGANDRPDEDQVIQSIHVDTKGTTYSEPTKVN
ncbi:peptidylprolyl isomerase [Erysipelothrix sp. HDW6C]|nr:peptidylprolyl isomerase [Erysipelothrix sp. HDW6C]QIK69017.1 peptidylprolyl isomerase [Erysipelothrix sp. HDW6C]